MANKQDPKFEAAVNDYIESVIHLEKKTYHSDLEPFEAHAEIIRKNISDAMHHFQKTYHHGYEVMLKELSEMFRAQKQKPDPLIPFKAKTNKLSILTDPVQFMEFLSQGKSIYELFGFSEDVLGKFYEAGCRLVEKKRFEDARDAFYFLVTIAPTIGEAWLGLGYSYAQCKEMNGAIQAFTCAIELMPQRADPYLTFARIYVELQDYDEALKVCDIGLQRAKENRPEPWAEELGSMMEEAKRQITDMYQNTEYQSYSS